LPPKLVKVDLKPDEPENQKFGVNQHKIDKLREEYNLKM
jgi:hypothetical protein